MTDLVGPYLQEIGRIPLLTAAEELEVAALVQRWQSWEGGPAMAPTTVQRQGRRAKDRMLKANLRLVVMVSKKYSETAQRLNIDLIDLIQEGTLGLDRAVIKFDPTRGYKFSTYAYWWIRQAVTRSLNATVGGSRMIKLPQHVAGLSYRLERHKAELAAREQPFCLQAFAKEIGSDPTKLQLSLDYITRAHTVSTDSPATEDNDTSLMDALGETSNAVWEGMACERFQELLGMLPAAGRKALDMHYIQGHSAQRVGKEMGVSVKEARALIHESRETMRILLEPICDNFEF